MLPPAVTQVSLPSGVCLPGERVLRAQGDATIVIGRGLVHAQQVDRQRRRAQPRPTSEKAEGAGAGEEEEDVADIIACVGGVVARDAVAVGPSSDLDVGTSAPRFRVVADGAKRYIPQVGDGVIGVILRVSPHSYAVHIGAATVASLDAVVAFDGASKSNRPKLVVGDLVYARVSDAEADAEVELSCCAVGDMPRKDWGTGEAVFGPLALGPLAASVVVSLRHADDLLHNRNTALMIAGARLGFEAVIGANGRVWARVQQGIPRKALVALTRIVVESADCTTPDAAGALVDRYFPPPAAAVAIGNGGGWGADGTVLGAL